MDGCIGDRKVDPGRVRRKDGELEEGQMDIQYGGGGVTLRYVGSGLLLNEKKSQSISEQAGRHGSSLISLDYQLSLL